MSANDFISRAEKTISKRSEITETDIENTYVKYAKNKGCKALKLIFLNKKGFPDRTTICPGGRVFFIEFKKKGKKKVKKPSPAQRTVRIALKSFGFEYYVCDEIGQAEKHLDSFLNNDKNN